MRYSFVFLLFFIFSLKVFSQKASPKFVEGEIYFKVKPEFAKKIKTTSKAVQISDEMPFFNDRIVKNKLAVSKIEKPFLNAKNKDLNNIIRLKISETENIDKVIDDLKADGYYQYVEKVPVRTIISVPSDTSYTKQWSLKKIKAPQAWDVNPGGSTVVVAVVDNAVQTNHIDLAANIVAGKDMSSAGDFDPNPPNATFNHGTHVAGIVSAVTNNITGIAAAANNKVKIMPIKATPDGGSANSIYYGFEGVQWAVDNGAKIVSLSWGGPGYSSAEQDVMDYAYNNGVLVVAAAGNENSDALNFPAAYNHVISVASLDSTDIRSSFSSFGSTVDISAPGRGILSTLPFDVYGSFSGTSMATPLVSSCLGYLWSCFPSLTLEQLEALIKSTADDISSQNPNFIGKLGAGRINLLNAVACKTENISDITLNISPSRYFCKGDTVDISTPSISGAVYSWKYGSQTLSDTDNSIEAMNEGIYSLNISKGFCFKNIDSKALIYNNLISDIPSVNQIFTQYCSGQNDTLKALSPPCVFPDYFTENFNGPTIGYDGNDQSGDSPSVTFANVPGLIDSLEVSIIWKKIDGGGVGSCGTADGGSVPFNEEVGFQLKSPSGQIFDLIITGTYARGATSSGLVTTVFKRNLPVVASNSLPTSGNFGPVTSFESLVGEIPSGTWTLLASDDSFLDPLCVSGFQVKVFTNANQATNTITWWDAPIGGNLIATSNDLVKSNLPIGSNAFFAQNLCSAKCPSPRKKAEIYVKPRPEIVGFPFDEIIITETQAREVASAPVCNISINSNNLYTVNGVNALGASFSYLISNKAPHYSPISICDSVDYALLAVGCNGQVSWSTGDVNPGIILPKLKTNTNISASCVQASLCAIQAPSQYSFFMASQNQTLSGLLPNNTDQNNYGKSISSNQRILPTSKLNYKASENILLTPGFSIESGNVFSAQIGGCQ